MDKPDANQCLRPHGTSVGLAVKDRYAFRFACRTHAFHLEDAIRRHGAPYRWEYLLSSPPEGEGGGLLGHEGSHDVKGQMLLIEGILEDQGTASAVGAAGDPGNQSAGPKVSFVDTEENLDLRTYFESFLDYMRVGYLGHQKRHTVLVHFVEGRVLSWISGHLHPRLHGRPFPEHWDSQSLMALRLTGAWLVQTLQRRSREA